MPVVPVPDLRRKFALLRTYSPRTSWESLAVPFGAAVKTVKYWGHGSETRAPDQLPAQALPVLLALCAELLPGAMGEADVHRLAFGPAALLEEALRSGTGASLAGLIARDGRTATGLLFRKTHEAGLIEVEADAATSGLPRLRLDEWFRIVFPLSPACRYGTVMQGVQQSWSPVPFLIDERPSRQVLVPGRDDAWEPRFMRERRDAGLHRFLCLQAAEPFPAAIGEYLREGTSFDKQGLDMLAGFYERQPAARRACHVLTVVIEGEV